MPLRRPGVLMNLAKFVSITVAGLITVAGVPAPAFAQDPVRAVEVIPASAPISPPTITAPVMEESTTRTESPIDFSGPQTITVPNVNFLFNGVPGSSRTYAKSPADMATNVGLTPTLVGASDGIAPNPRYPFEFEYTVCPFEAAGISSNSCSNLATKVTPAAYSGWVRGSWTIPVGKLSANKTYRWSVSVRTSPYMGTLFNADYWFSTGSQIASPGNSDFSVELGSWPSSQQIIGALTPTLSASLRHKPQANYEYQFEVKSCDGSNYCSSSATVAKSGWSSSSTWTVPSGALVWNSAYTWTVSARKDSGYGTLFNPSRTFATMVPAPSGSIWGLDGGATRVAGVSLADRHFEHAETDASLPSLGIPLAVTRSYSSTNTRVGAFGTGWSSVFDTSVSNISSGKVVRLADGHEVAFGLNANGSWAPAPGSQGMKMASCSSPCETKFTDLAGSEFTFGASGLASITTSEGFVTSITRGSDGKITAIADGGSGRSFTVLWSGTKVTSITLAGAPSGTKATWTYTYSGDLLVKVCRPAATAVCASYGYSASPNKLVTVTSPAGATTTAVSFTGSRVASVTTPAGTTNFATKYVTGGTEVTVSSVTGAVDVYALDAAGRTVKVTNSRGGVEQWKYDALGRTLGYQSAQGVFVRLQYGANGALVGRVTYRPDNKISAEVFTYTTSGKLQLVTAPGSKYTYYFDYSPPTLDELRTAAATEYEYDSSGRVSAIIAGPTGTRATERYTYTSGTEAASDGGLAPKGLIKTVTDAGNKVTTFVYTRQGLLASSKDPLGTVNAYTYDWAGRLTAKTTSGTGFTSFRSAFSYDGAGLLVGTTAPLVTDAVTGETHQISQSFTYNADGFALSSTTKDLRSNSARTTAYALDSYGRVLKQTGPDGSVQLTNTYDRAGQLVTSQNADNLTTRYDRTPSGDVAAKVVTMAGTNETAVLERATYDGAGRVSTMTDRAGVTRTFTYLSDEKIRSITAAVPQPDGSFTTVTEVKNTYNANGDLSASERDGGVTRIEYDPLRRPVKLTTSTGDTTGPAARQIERTYDARGLVTRESVSASAPVRTVDYAYDDAGNLRSTTVGSQPGDPAASVTTYQRDGLGRMVTVTDPRSTAEAPVTTQLTWDALGRQTSTSSVSEGVSRTTKTGYDAFGNITSLARPSGAVATSKFDAYDRRISSTAWHGSSESAPEESWSYEASGLIAGWTDLSGVQTTYDRDFLGQIVQSTRHGDTASTETYTYDSAGNQISTTDAMGNKTEATYDAMGHQTTQSKLVAGRTATTSYGYDVRGNRTSVTTAEGRMTEIRYNALGEVVGTTEPDGRSRTITRDAAGRMVQQTDSTGVTTWTNYDAQGNAVRISDIDPSTNKPLRSWNWTYDRAGNQLTQINPNGGQRSFGYRGQDDLASVTFEDGSVSSMSYDVDGNTIGYTDQNGNTTSATYTAQGWLKTLVEPSVPGATSDADRLHTWAYNPIGEVTATTAPGGSSRAYTRDSEGRVVVEVATTDGKRDSRSFEYDALGRMVRFAHPDGIETIEYDSADHVLRSTGPAGNSRFTYDLDGNMTSRNDAAGTTIYTWDSASRLANVLLPDGEKRVYEYSGQKVTKVTDSRGEESFGYDLLGNATSHKLTSNGATLMEDKYSFDPAGNRTNLQSTRQGETSYQYDLRGRLTGWTDGSATHRAQWDAAGNLVSLDDQARSYDARNRLTSLGSETFTYSPDGRRLGAGQVRYGYDSFGQLITAGNDRFAYDALGRLAKDGSAKLKYAGLERDAASINDQNILRDPQGRPLDIEGSRVLSDVRSDVIATTDADGLTPRSYSPFGVTDSSGDGGIGFQGDYQSAGLVNMDARWYDTTSGTFLSRDDISLTVDEQNRYGYAMSNPIRYNDPSGHCVAAAAPACAGGALCSAAGPIPAAACAVGGLIVGTVATIFFMDEVSKWSFDFSQLTGSASGSSVATSSPYAVGATYSPPYLSGFKTPSVPTITISMPDLSSSIPTFDFGWVADIEWPSFHISIPQFGIDRPSWAYPDPFTADGSTVAGAGALGIAATCGAGASSTCKAAVGTIGASCAPIGGSASNACAPAVAGGLWANEPAAGQAPGGGESLSRISSSAPHADCPPDQVSTDLGCEDLFDLLQRKVDDLRDRYSNNKAERDQSLTSAELRAEAENPWLSKMNNGKAIERGLADDPLIAKHFDWKGGANAPDFISKSTGSFYEVTTTNTSTLAQHLSRWYVHVDRIAKYTMWTFGG